MNASTYRTMIFVDFNVGAAHAVTLEGHQSLVPTIDALSRGPGAQSVQVPNHPNFGLQGGETDGSLSLGVFQGTRPIAIIYIGCGEGASKAWVSMDGLCHRVFGSPMGELPTPPSPWTVLVRFPRLRDNPSYDWLADFAQDVGRAWVDRAEWAA